MSKLECREGVEYLYYSGVDANEFRVPRDGPWDLLRACIDDAEQRNKQTAMRTAYGRCPHCGARCVERERRPNGNDRCKNGHVYPSSAAV